MRANEEKIFSMPDYSTRYRNNNHREGIPMNKQPANQREGDLPAGLSQPAQRALAGAGISQLQQLSSFRESEIKQLHGIGPKAIRHLRQALAERPEPVARRPARKATTFPMC